MSHILNTFNATSIRIINPNAFLNDNTLICPYLQDKSLSAEYVYLRLNVFVYKNIVSYIIDKDYKIRLYLKHTINNRNYLIGEINKDSILYKLDNNEDVMFYCLTCPCSTTSDQTHTPFMLNFNLIDRYNYCVCNVNHFMIELYKQNVPEDRIRYISSYTILSKGFNVIDKYIVTLPSNYNVTNDKDIDNGIHCNTYYTNLTDNTSSKSNSSILQKSIASITYRIKQYFTDQPTKQVYSQESLNTLKFKLFLYINSLNKYDKRVRNGKLNKIRHLLFDTEKLKIFIENKYISYYSCDLYNNPWYLLLFYKHKNKMMFDKMMSLDDNVNAFGFMKTLLNVIDKGCIENDCYEIKPKNVLYVQLKIIFREFGLYYSSHSSYYKTYIRPIRFMWHNV